MRSLTAASFAVLACMTGLAAPAAGQYQLHSCRLPGGTFSPLVDWTPTGGIDGRYVRGDWCVSLGYF